ncbi:MAG: hypothetical protein L0241_23755 [Planctomycetia bacterium]|nr:hypothetical protein [Planctomycetia bacterium]
MKDNEEKKDPEKTVDLPPYGSRNPDPITDAPGSHPIETGIGAAVGGAATGAAAGVALGPPGVILGTVLGAVAGGFAGKGIGELIDPTTEDNWIREWLAERRRENELEEEKAASAYRFGMRAEADHTHETFDEAKEQIRAAWEAKQAREHEKDETKWDDVDDSVRAGFNRMRKLRTGV